MSLAPLITDLLSRLDARRRGLLYRALKKEDHVARLWLAPWEVMESPDEHQKAALSDIVTKGCNTMLLWARGTGKSETFAAAAFVEGCLGGFTMILSRSDRQAMDVMVKVKGYVNRLQERYSLPSLTKDTAHEIIFENGGKVLALPCSPDTIVGKHGVTLLGIDEASRCPEAFYSIVTPMLTVSYHLTGIKPRLLLPSTPFGQRGFFWEEWEGSRRRDWKRHKVTWHDNPRADVEEIRNYQETSETYYRQEYECEFISLASGFFDVTRLEACEVPDEDDLDNPDVLDLQEYAIEDGDEGGIRW